MAARSWLQLAMTANVDAIRFQYIIRDPRSVRPNAKMPAHKDYDDATLHALTEYFRTFVAPMHGVRPGENSAP